MESKYNSWLKAEHNWNQVCNAGMTYGAMAIYEDQPVLAKEIINRAISSIVLPMHVEVQRAPARPPFLAEL